MHYPLKYSIMNTIKDDYGNSYAIIKRSGELKRNGMLSFPGFTVGNFYNDEVHIESVKFKVLFLDQHSSRDGWATCYDLDTEDKLGIQVGVVFFNRQIKYNVGDEIEIDIISLEPKRKLCTINKDQVTEDVYCKQGSVLNMSQGSERFDFNYSVISKFPSFSGIELSTKRDDLKSKRRATVAVSMQGSAFNLLGSRDFVTVRLTPAEYHEDIFNALIWIVCRPEVAEKFKMKQWYLHIC